MGSLVIGWWRWLQSGELEEAIWFLMCRYGLSDGEAWAWCIQVLVVRPWDHAELGSSAMSL